MTDKNRARRATASGLIAITMTGWAIVPTEHDEPPPMVWLTLIDAGPEEHPAHLPHVEPRAVQVIPLNVVSPVVTGGTRVIRAGGIPSQEAVGSPSARAA